MADLRRSLYRARPVIVAVLAAVTVLVGPGVASAHTAFESSVPSDGAVGEGPLTDVVVNFTNPARPAGDGFELLDPSGQVRIPTSIDETDGTSFVLSFDPPLTAGAYGVRWQVQAGDAHPIDGSFRFVVTASADTTVVPPTTPLPAKPAPPPSVAVTTTVAPSPSSIPAGASVTLDTFLDETGSGDEATAVGGVARTFTFLGLIFGLGALAALVWVIRGRRDELLTQLAWIRLAGLVIATGGLVELAALHAGHPAGALELLDTKPGIAAMFKIVGGLAVLVGFRPRVGRVSAPPQALSAAVAAEMAPDTSSGAVLATAHRWEPTTAAWLGLTGFVVVLASFWFDGHTVSKGPWIVHAAANTVHLGAAAVWGGGVFAMTTIVWMRRRADERTQLAAMVVRFSALATVSLLAVIAAGLAMAIMILDRPGDLVDTEWGRLLLAKTAAVAVAAGIGAFNHFRLRPALERRPDDPALAHELRITLAVESAIFVVVIVLTAWLVAAAI